MRSPGINGEGELRGQLANPGSPGKWPLKQSVYMCLGHLHGYDCAASIKGVVFWQSIMLTVFFL